MADVGKALLLIGFIIVLLGLILTFSERIPFPIGRLPGDIVIKRDGMSFYFPIVSSIILSILLTLILNLIFGLRK
jgi:hypothetical protein